MSLSIHTVNVDNYQKQFHVSVADNIRQICSILSPYGITHFSHGRNYNSEAYSLFTTHPEFSEIFIREQFYTIAYCAKASQYQSCVVLSNQLDIPSISQAQLQTGIANVIVFVKPYKDYVDFWWFGTKPEFSQAKEFYLSNIDLLENFIDYFKQKASKLLNELYKHRMIYCGKWNDTTKLVTSEINDINLNATIQQIEENQRLYSIALKKNFTIEELKCASYLIQGFSPKEIARTCDKSVRTIEKQLLSLRYKMNSRSLLHLATQLARISG